MAADILVHNALNHCTLVERINLRSRYLMQAEIFKQR